MSAGLIQVEWRIDGIVARSDVLVNEHQFLHDFTNSITLVNVPPGEHELTFTVAFDPPLCNDA